MKPQTDSDEDARAQLDRIMDGQLCAEHDRDLEAILAPMVDSIVHDVIGSTDGPVRGVEAVRRRYQEFLTATVHERDIPIRRLYGKDFVFDEHAWHGRLTGPRVRDRRARALDQLPNALPPRGSRRPDRAANGLERRLGDQKAAEMT